MVAGITLLGVVTATFASWLIEQVAVKEQEETADLRSDIATLSKKLDELVLATTTGDADVRPRN